MSKVKIVLNVITFPAMPDINEAINAVIPTPRMPLGYNLDNKNGRIIL